MFHGIVVDGLIERIYGTPDLAEAKVLKLRKAGHTSEYLFATRTEEEFELKKQKERQSTRPVNPATNR